MGFVLSSIPISPARNVKMNCEDKSDKRSDKKGDKESVNESDKEIAGFAQIKSISDLERISTEVIWQNFERLTGYIFEQNDFSIEINRVKTQKRRRRQYDVIARSTDLTILVECKKWSGHRPRLSALKKAVDQHKERCAFYQALTGIEAVAVVVTLIEEEINSYEGVPIVPILKLNSFIAEMVNGTYG